MSGQVQPKIHAFPEIDPYKEIAEAIQELMEVLEKISLIALGIFGAYTCPKLFFPTCGVGIALGIFLQWRRASNGGDTRKCEGSIGCSQGTFEDMTGYKLPAPVGIGINIAILTVHMGHHHLLYGGVIAGLNVGVWIGGTATAGVQLISRGFSKLPPPQPQQCCPHNR